MCLRSRRRTRFERGDRDPVHVVRRNRWRMSPSHLRFSMSASSSSRPYPCRRANRTRSRARSMTAPCSGAAATVIPRPRRKSRSPSSRNARNARSTVFVFTARTAARSRAGGSRSPGLASPSAIARRISAATCSCRSSGPSRSIVRAIFALMVLVMLASSQLPRRN